ncbi:MAG: hypothetical protein HY000_31955 [Planctomycetes bacterium]|nr:hypothetical protein [Planctomycetota bacterium]
MASKLPTQFVELVQDALLKSFWTKRALRTFLRRSGIPDHMMGQLNDADTKRDWLDYLFPQLESSEKGIAIIQQMATSLSEKDSFADLENWEDSADKIRAASVAVATLSRYFARKHEEKLNAEEVARNRRFAEEIRDKYIRSTEDLGKLKARLDTLAMVIGTQQAGYDFQTWFYDLMDFADIDNRRPYSAPDGRQIDGSITIDGTTYLAELKFTASQSGATDIDSILAKVNAKADNTMAIMVSMSGYSSVALGQASFPKSPLLLLDYSHLYMALAGVLSFPDIVRRVRRHSSQEGMAYLAVHDFGG